MAGCAAIYRRQEVKVLRSSPGTMAGRDDAMPSVRPLVE